MAFKSLKLRNFRSYPDASYSFEPGANVIVGPNGIGKTNILEALYVLGRGKSFRAPAADLIHKGEDWYLVEAQFGKSRLEIRHEQQERGSRKTIKVGRKASSLEDLIAKVPLVLFEPSDNEIITGSPDRRRRFLDGILSATDREYLRALVAYRRLIKQRNMLLRRNGQLSADLQDQLFVWDVKLVELAALIAAAREKLAAAFSKRLAEIYRDLSGEQHDFGLSYLVRPSDTDYASALMSELERRAPRDLLLGATSIGPHRDELGISMDGHEAAQTVSRGEARTLVLALKLLELDYVREHHATPPVLLLDDVFSELDAKRQQLVLSRLRDQQTIITTTEIDQVGRQTKAKSHIIKL